MYRKKRVSVVIPAYNEENQIGSVLKTIPEFVDKIIVVDDKSQDRTVKVVQDYQTRCADSRVILIRHEKNQGCGASRVTGLKKALKEKSNIAVLMDGDKQMSPDDLPNLINPLIDNKVDFTKGNRLITGKAWKIIPKIRYLGNAVLSLFTKIASGYWHIADSQCGYAAVTSQVLKTIDMDKLYKTFGMPNDILVHLNVYNFRVRDVPVRPIYNIGEKSGIRIGKVIFTISFLLLRRFFWRLKEKYIVRDFHPLVFFYALSFLLLLIAIPLGIRILYFWIFHNTLPKVNILAFMFAAITGLQSLFFAMWFDMEYNKELR